VIYQQPRRSRLNAITSILRANIPNEHFFIARFLLHKTLPPVAEADLGSQKTVTDCFSLFNFRRLRTQYSSTGAIKQVTHFLVRSKGFATKRSFHIHCFPPLPTRVRFPRRFTATRISQCIHSLNKGWPTAHPNGWPPRRAFQ